MEHITVYRHADSYVHNPDVVKLASGELLMVFRQAPRRRQCTHIDPQSKALLLRSADNGRTWDKSPPIVAAAGSEHTGIQDPSLCVLRNGAVMCNFFTWYAPPDAPYGAEVPGAFAVTSADEGRTWDTNHIMVDLSGHAGGFCATTDAVVETPEGDLLMPLYDNKLAPTDGGGHRCVLYRSTDGGDTWREWGTMAYDPFNNLDFCEPALALLPSGKLVAMMREERHKECLWQSESLDGGRTWSRPRRTLIWGYPADLIVLKSGKLLCTYGYRRPPYGVRACLSSDEGKTWDYRNELVLRNDGFGPDVGYPSSVQLGDGTIFTAYYINEPPPAAPGQAASTARAVGPGRSFFDPNIRALAASFYKEW